jgi:predicted nucleic acid-binding protein
VIVLDTSVLVYATGRDHPLREPSRRLVDAIGDGDVEATSTVEVIQEFAHVRARRRPRVDAVEQARGYVALLRPLMAPQEDDLMLGLELFQRHDLGMFDAVLAATTVGQVPDARLVSADRAFATVPGLHRLDPGAKGFLTDLGLT